MMLGSDGKTYKGASNACVTFFLAWVKYVQNFMLFCCKSELCCDFALLGVVLMAFSLVNLYFYFKRGTNTINYIILASIDVWQSCFAHTCSQIHFTMFCRKFTLAKIYALFLGKKKFRTKPCLCKKLFSFQVWCWVMSVFVKKVKVLRNCKPYMFFER